MNHCVEEPSRRTTIVKMKGHLEHHRCIKENVRVVTKENGGIPSEEKGGRE